MGDDDFFHVLRAWAAQRAGSTGTTDQFESLAESISGEQLDGLFHEWLFTAHRPAHCGAGAAVPPGAVPPIATPDGLRRFGGE